MSPRLPLGTERIAFAKSPEQLRRNFCAGIALHSPTTIALRRLARGARSES